MRTLGDFFVTTVTADVEPGLEVHDHYVLESYID
jgi:hypothetical protein